MISKLIRPLLRGVLIYDPMCPQDGHIFLWASSSTAIGPPSWIRCRCGAVTYGELIAVRKGSDAPL
jgi:hypothetical protein